MDLDKSQIGEVERHIFPSMDPAILIPVLGTNGVVIYVGGSLRSLHPTSVAEVTAVAQRLTLTPE